MLDVLSSPPVITLLCALAVLPFIWLAARAVRRRDARHESGQRPLADRAVPQSIDHADATLNQIVNVRFPIN